VARDDLLAPLFNDACSKAKLILRELLPHIPLLKTDAVFTPRLMRFMLERVEGKLTPIDREAFANALDFLELFAHRQLSADVDQPRLLASRRDSLEALLSRVHAGTNSQ